MKALDESIKKRNVVENILFIKFSKKKVVFFIFQSFLCFIIDFQNE